MKETPKHQSPFTITIDGKQAFLAENVTIVAAIDESSTKDLDEFRIRDHASVDEIKPWPTDFSLSVTMEPTPDFRRFVNRMLGRVRSNRGSSRTVDQRHERKLRYWVKVKWVKYLKPKYTLADYHKFNPRKPPF